MAEEARKLQAKTHGMCVELASRRRKGFDVGFISAVEYWGVPKPEGCSLDERLIHTAHLLKSTRCRAKGTKGHIWRAGSHQIPIGDGMFTVASPPCAWAQCARFTTDQGMIAIGSAFLLRDPSRRMCSRENILEYLRSAEYFKDKNRCLKLVDDLVEGTDSPTEVTLFSFLRSNGIGPLTVNPRVDCEGQYWFIDIAVERLRLGFEYQGAYHADVSQMRKDAHKLNQLQRLHWAIVQVTADDMRTEDSRKALLKTIRDVAEAQKRLSMVIGWG